ncbi:hypothetical protein V1511DRAFT_504974 [Dipodascopsis uninucleata]
MDGIRTVTDKKKKKKVQMLAKEPEMKVKREIDILASGSSSGISMSNPKLKSQSKSFGTRLKFLEMEEGKQKAEDKDIIVSRGLMGEGEITFKVEDKKKRSNDQRDDENGSNNKERDMGRKKQRFLGRRSASKNVFRRLGAM